MKARQVREQLQREVCSISDDVLYGHDERIGEYGESSDPMRRLVRRNPDYLAVIERAYDGDRRHFAADLERSLALVGEEQVSQEQIENLSIKAAKQALDICAFNEFALHFMVAQCNLNKKQRDVDNLFSLLSFSIRTLVLNPGNTFVRLVLAGAANLLGWHWEAARVLEPVRSKAMIGRGAPVLNYLSMREQSEALVLLLAEHKKDKQPGLPEQRGPLNIFTSLNSSIVNFEIWSNMTKASKPDCELDETRELLYRAAYDALKVWAVSTGRIEAAEADIR